MTNEKKALPIRLFEADDYPVRLAELESASVSLMKAGFKDQAHKVREVYADFVEYVLGNGLDVLFSEGIDNSREAAKASDRMQTKLRFKKLKRKHRKTKKKWLCCKKPRLSKRRTGERVWMTTCRYRDLAKRQVRVMNMMLGKDPSKKPKSVTLKGKKMRWCTGQNAK